MDAELNTEQKFDGYVKKEHILVRPEAWRRLWAGLDADAVKERLRRVELLIAGLDGDVPSLERFRSKAPPARFYVLAKAFVELA